MTFWLIEFSRFIYVHSFCFKGYDSIVWCMPLYFVYFVFMSIQIVFVWMGWTGVPACVLFALYPEVGLLGWVVVNFFLIKMFYYSWAGLSLCSPSWPRTCYTDRTGHKLRDPLDSSCWVCIPSCLECFNIFKASILPFTAGSLHSVATIKSRVQFFFILFIFGDSVLMIVK